MKKGPVLSAAEGFTLMEIVLTGMVAIFLSLLVANLPSSIRLVGISSRVSIAKDILGAKLEEIRSISFDNLANGDLPFTDLRLNKLPEGSGTYSISDCPDTICTNSEQVKKLFIQVKWKEGGNHKTSEITTLLTKGGL